MATEKAIGNEDGSERRLKAKQRDRVLDMGFGDVTKRQAEADKQYE